MCVCVCVQSIKSSPHKITGLTKNTTYRLKHAPHPNIIIQLGVYFVGLTYKASQVNVQERN